MGRWVLILSSLAVSGCFNSLLLTPVNSGGPIEETMMTPAKKIWTRNKVAVIDVDGVILNAKSSGLFGGGDNPVSLFREKLEEAAHDRRVKAVVLRLNTPGGAVTASDIMYRDLLHFRQKTNKPVVGCMMDVAASGGYYLAMACDYVYAHPSSVTGSIGVIMNLYNASGLFAMLGVKSDPIKSGPNKDIGNPLRLMKKEERLILQGMVDNFYNQFVKVVVAGRKMDEKVVRKLADGRVYTGIQAKELGLVDEIGYLPDAIRTAKSLASIIDARIVAYDRSAGYRGSIYAKMPSIPSQIQVKLDMPGLSNSSGATFMYLWEPGTVR